MAYIEVLLLLTIIGYLLYLLGTKNFDYFEKRKIPFEKPWPFVGNMLATFLRHKSLYDVFIEGHMKFKCKYYGFFNMMNAQITIRDPELIKQICVKDFDHFVNHYAMIDANDDTLMGNHLVVLKDQKWKDMRTILSPAFTGSKLRFMFELIRECSTNAMDYVEEEMKKANDLTSDNIGFLKVEGKDFFTRYTHNVIASTAFGLKVNSFRDTNNEFFKKSREATNFTSWVLMKFVVFMFSKRLAKLLRLNIFDKEFKSYFVNLVMDTISFRLKNNIVRPDMINLLLEARKEAKELQQNGDNKLREWTDDELVAQCFLFFVAGFETSSNLMCFAVMELMANPEVQEKLYEEIVEMVERKESEGKPVTYENIQEMKYLDMVVSETLRKWPPGVLTDRVCNKPYTLKDDRHEVELQPGDVIWINIVGMHYDPETFEQPHVFDPERFSDENKANINPFLYLPFGVGPRTCIAKRLALIQAKMILFNLVSKFRIEASEKTVLPLAIDPKSVMVQPKGGFNFILKSRS